MGQNVKENLILALRKMLKPLVKLLINQGVTHGDFSEAAKDVYVEVAIRKFDKSRKINQSKVAILTGLTRKEVKNVVDRILSAETRAKNFSRPGRVLLGWHSDPMYIGPYGVPLELPYESANEGDATFSSLVRAYSGDMAPRQMLEILTRVGAVVELENAMYKPVRREFAPDALSPELVERLGKVGAYFFATVSANIEKNEDEPGYFDRRVFVEDGVSPNTIQEFDSLIKVRGQEFLEDLDNWFVTKQKVDQGHPDRKKTGLLMVHYVADERDDLELKEILAERGLEKNSQYEK